MRMFDNMVEVMGKNLSVYRNGVKIYSTKGVISKDAIFDFPYDSDIQIGDTIVVDITKDEYLVQKIRKELCILSDEIDFLEVDCTPQPKESNSSIPRNIIYNIGTANNSTFGDNTVINYNVTFNTLEKVIVENGYSTEDFKELLETLKTAIENDNCQKGFLSRFGDTLSKHAWLSSPIAQLLISHFFAK